MYKHCDPDTLIQYDGYDFINELAEPFIYYSIEHLRRDWPLDFYSVMTAVDDFCAQEDLLIIYGCLDADL
jgi:hypothetical protein